MLLRRLAGTTVPVVLLLGATACQEQVPAAQRPQTPAAAAAAMPAYWKDAPATDEQRVALLDRLRAIDPCALLPRTALTRFGEVSRVENDEPDGCEATFGSAELGEGTTISWRTGVAPDGYGWGSSKRETVDGITVGTLGDSDSANPPGHRVDRTCTATTAFGNTATLPVIVRTPLGTEPCPIAEAALTQAMVNLAVEPPRGTSPDAPRTALLAKDPCAVATVLGVSAPVRERRVWSCAFTFRGDEISVDYNYESEGVAARGEPIFVVNGHKAYGNTGEHALYTAVIGPSLPGTGSTTFGPEVPTIEVFGKDRAAVEAVLRAATELFPEE
ncbi:hypothetical protein ACIA5E_09180 [Nocardia asteroides]|uniref:hypothetical protein n=1 Tax=Nocardia asteroides TaxID=1824 RepID=UPI00379180CF